MHSTRWRSGSGTEIRPSMTIEAVVRSTSASSDVSGDSWAMSKSRTITSGVWCSHTLDAAAAVAASTICVPRRSSTVHSTERHSSERSAIRSRAGGNRGLLTVVLLAKGRVDGRLVVLSRAQRPRSARALRQIALFSNGATLVVGLLVARVGGRKRIATPSERVKINQGDA